MTGDQCCLNCKQERKWDPGTKDQREGEGKEEHIALSGLSLGEGLYQSIDIMTSSSGQSLSFDVLCVLVSPVRVKLQDREKC